MNSGQDERPSLQWVQARCHDLASNRLDREDLIYRGCRIASVSDLIVSDPARFADPARPLREVVPQKSLSFPLVEALHRIDTAAESGDAEFQRIRERLLAQHRIALISPYRRMQGLYAIGMTFEVIEGSLHLGDPDEETTTIPLQGLPVGFYQGRPWLLDTNPVGNLAPRTQYGLSLEEEGRRQEQLRAALNQGQRLTGQDILVFPGAGRLPTPSGWLDYALDIPPGGLAPLPAVEDPQWDSRFAPRPEWLQEHSLDDWMRVEGLAPSPPDSFLKP